MKARGVIRHLFLFAVTLYFASSAVAQTAAVQFVKQDVSTRGSWEGTYGADGVDLANVSGPVIPGYATFAVQNQANFTWSPNPTDPRALEIGSNRIAATWYNGGSFSFDVNITGTHQFALYALDWDSQGRAEKIQILDAATNNLLNEQDISNFSTGLYLIWNISGHVTINVINNGGVNAVISGAFFDPVPSGGVETVTINPSNVTLGTGQTQQFGATVTNATSQTVTWTISQVNPSTADPGSFSTTTPGLYTAPGADFTPAQVTIKATSADGTAFGTATVNLTAGATAQFVKQDTGAEGNWEGIYGADGRNLADVSGPMIPPYATFAVQNGTVFPWAPSSTDTRALETGVGSNRIAATWYNGGSFSFDVNITGTHQFSLYALDWDAKERAEKIQIRDASTNSLLDEENISDFSDGLYLVWNISGHVTVTIVNNGGPNAVISGAFFDPVPSGGAETVTINPLSVTLDAGQTQQFGASVTNATSQTVTWTISRVNPSTADPGSFSTTTPGLYTAPQAGTISPSQVTIKATSADGTVFGTATVNLVSLVAIAVTPPNPTISDGSVQQFKATGTYSDTSTKDLTSAVMWSSSSMIVATIDSVGLAASTGQGQTTVQAASGVISNSTTLTVTAASTAAVQFVKQDVSTRGSWEGTYGADGVDLANVSGPVIPGYATFAVQNQANFTWSPNPTDPRALEIGSNRIAATWYNGGSFSFDVNITGTHQFALYALDWDSQGRAEKIQILDAATNNLLNEQDISNFSTGLYLIWNISGHVTINVINNGGVNAVISGAFFDPVPSGGVETVTINPSNVTLGTGQTQQFGATVTNATSQTVTWTISQVNPSTADPGSFSTTTPGLYTAPGADFTPAQVTIKATSADGTAFGTATVNLTAGATAQFVKQDTGAEGNWEGIYGADGRNLADVSGPMIPPYATFAVQNGTVFPWAPSSTDTRALETGVGSNRIAATWYNGGSFSFDVNITGTHQFSLYALDWDAKERAEKIQIRDASTNSLLDEENISDFSDGLYLVWNISGHVTVTIVNNGGPNAVISGAFFGGSSLVSIAVTPTNPSIASGLAQQFTAIGTYSDNSTADLTATVTWNSVMQSAATITAGGLATGIVQGASTIQASLGGITGSTVLTVNAPVLTSIAVTPARPSIAKGVTQQFAATGTYTDNSTADLTAMVTWNSVMQSAVTISAGGLARGVGQGTSTIQASIGGVTGSTVLTVTAAALSSIAITPANPSIAKGQMQQFAATGTYSDGSMQDLTASVTWSSSATNTATINSGGLASAVAFGGTTITATSGSVNGSTSFNVTAGFVQTGSLNAARWQATATLLNNGMVLIAGGYGSSGPLASAELYDPVNRTFTNTGDLTTPTYESAATLLSNGMVLIAGGFNFGALADAELFDPATGMFTPGGILNAARSSPTLTLLSNGTVLIAGGYDQGSLSSAELYDPATGMFTTTGSLNIGRVGDTATLLNNGRVLIAGGSGHASESAELYDPATGMFNTTGNPNTPRYLATATLLNNGMVLVAGGSGPSGPLSSAELYNPAKGTFTSTGMLNTARYGALATLLTDGTVLIAGGQDSSGFSPSAELYNPATGTFTATGSLNSARFEATATLLNNGMVLFAGGSLPSAELYEPDTLTPSNLVSISVTPTNVTIPLDTAQQFIATGTFSDNSTQQLSSVTWNSSNSAIATITNDSTNLGHAYGVAQGTALLTACAGSVCGSTSITVGAPALVSIAVTPANPSVTKGLTQQFTAIGTYSDGGTLNLTSQVTWRSATTMTASITSPGGLATGVGTGATNITASLGGVMSPDDQLTVTAATLQSIVVTPANPSIAKGLTQQFTATGTYSDTSTGDVTGFVTWNSDAQSTATIDAAGLATGVGQGTSTIQASLSGVTGSTTLAVGAPVLASITVQSVPPYAPQARRWEGLAYDSVRGKIVLFGGIDVNGNYLNDIWEWDTTAKTWTNVTPTAGSMPLPRASFGMAYDPNRQKVVIYGGTVSTAYSNVGIVGDTWEWDGATRTWAPATEASPIVYAGLWGAQLAYDPNLKQVILFGGQPYWATPLNSGTYAWDGTTWNLITTSGPSGRIYTAMTTDSGRSKVVLFGGSSGYPTYSSLGDTWEWDGTRWTQVAVGATLPSSRYGTGLSYDSTRQVNVLFGGINGEQDTWEWDGANWTQRTGSGAPSFIWTTMAFDSGRSQLVVFGETQNSGPQGTLDLAHLDGNGVLDYSATFANTAVLGLGQSVPMQVTGTYSDGTGQDVTGLANWNSSSTAIAGVASSGVTTGASQGSTTITATLTSITGSIPITVIGPVLTSLTVTPTNATIAEGTAVQYTATGTYTDGSMLDLTSSVTWTSSSGAALISISPGSQGLATGVSLGSTTIMAGLNSVTGTTNLQVNAPSLVSIAITPATPSIAKGLTQQFTATGTYSDNSTADLTATVTWSSATQSVATITTGGLATAVGQGTSTIQAQFSGVSGSTLLTVTAPSLTSIAITPQNPSIIVGLSQQFSAVGHFSDGSSADISSLVTWGSTSTNVATISGTGLATSAGLGSTTISASYSGASNSTGLTVTSTVTFTPRTPRFAYTPYFGSGIYSYTVNASTGALTTVSGSPFASGQNPYSVAIDPTGKFVYIPSANSNSVYGYTIDAGTGALTPVAGSPFATGSYPYSVAVDPSGRFVYVANESSFNVSAYTIDASTGALTPVAGSPFAAGSYPYSVAIDPSGQFVYVANEGSSNVSGYKINSSTGALTAISGSPFAAGTYPYSVAVDPSSRFVYVANEGSNNVSAYMINSSTGALTAVSGSPFAAGSNPFSVVIDLSGRFVYVANEGSNNVSAYVIDVATGALDPVAGSPFAATSIEPTALAIDPSDNFLYAVGYGYYVQWDAINATTGALTTGGTTYLGIYSYGVALTAGPTTASTATMTALEVLPANPTILSGSLGQKQQFQVRATFSDGSTQFLTNSASWSSTNTGVATITNTSGSKGLATTVGFGSTTVSATVNSTTASTTLTVSSPPLTSITLAPANTTINLGTAEQFSAVGHFSDGSSADISSLVTWGSTSTNVATISGTGLATSAGLGSTTISASYSGASNSTGLTVTSTVTFTPRTPRFAYTPYFGSGIYSYTVNASTGALTTVSGSPFASGQNPYSVAIDPTGKFVYIPSANSNSVYGYTIDAGTGALTPVAGSPFATGSYPYSVAVDPSGRFVYVANESSFNVSAYTIDASTGALTPVAGSPFAAGSYPYSVAIDPSGQFVYVANEGSSNVSGYKINSSTGALTAISGSPFAAGTYPYSVAVDPSSRFVYVANEGSNNVSAYMINSSTGALTAVSGSPFAAGSNPFSVVIDLSGRFVYVANEGSNNVSAYVIDVATGALDPVAGSPFAATSIEPTALAIDPSDNFLYAVGYGYYVQWDAINATTGALTTGGTTYLGIYSYGVALTAGPTTASTATMTALEVLPANPTILSGSLGQKQQFQVRATFSDGSTQFLTNSASWSSTNTGVATITNTSGSKGLATTVGFGSTTVSATVNSTTASTTLTVSSPPLTSITLAPANTTINLGTAEQFSAVGHFSDGSSADISSLVTWGSTSTNVATISGTGLATSAGLGSTTISASYSGASNSTGLTVTSTVTFTPRTPRFAYTPYYYGNGSIYGYTVSASTGALTTVSGSPFASGQNQFSVAIDPTGKFVYVSSANSNSVYGYTIDAGTGALTPVAGSPFAVGSYPYSVAVDPSGRFVYVANESSFNVSAYTIDASTGALTPVAGSPFAAGSYPYSVAIDPSGQFVYVANEGSSNVSGYKINSSTGALTAVSGSPFAAGTYPYSVAVDPSSRFVYVANEGSNNVFAYTINGSTGALTAVSGSPFAAGSNPFSVVVDLSGRFVYVANEGSNNVSAYVIDVATGALDPVSGSPFAATSVEPTALAIDPSDNFLYAVGLDYEVQWYRINATTGALTTGGTTSGIYSYGVALTAGPTTASTATMTALEVLPANPTILSGGLGQKQQFQVRATFSDGTTQFLTNSASWSSTNTGVATITNTSGSKGLATTVGFGSTTVSATVNSTTASTTLTSTSATLLSIDVTPATPTISVGTAIQFFATGHFSDSTTANITNSVTWASSATNVAGINANGLATTTGLGSSTITASVGNVNQTATLTVVP